MPPKLTSPVFEYEIPAGLPPGGVYTKNLELVAETTGDYAPFNTLTVDNFSTKKLRVDYAGGHYVIVRGNSMAEIDQPGIRSFSLTNLSDTPTDETVMVYVQKRVTAEIALESIARRIPLEELLRGQ